MADQIADLGKHRFRAFIGWVAVTTLAFLAASESAASVLGKQLRKAVQKGQAEKVSSLLNEGASANASDSSGLTPLMIAARNGDLGIVDLLFDAGGDPLARAMNGSTALELAAAGGFAEIVRGVLEAAGDADVFRQERQHQIVSKALASARNNAHHESARILEETIEALRLLKLNRALVKAVANSDLEALKQNLSAGADPNARDENGMPALLVALSKFGHSDIPRLLLAAGADVGTWEREEREQALRWSARKGEAELVGVVLAAGVEVDARDDHGTVALQSAVAWGCRASQPSGHIEVVTSLLAADADVEVKNLNNGRTPLIVAAMEASANTAQLLQILLDGGADIDARDDNGMTALMYAAAMGKASAAKMLLKNGADINMTDPTETTALGLALLIKIQNPGREDSYLAQLNVFDTQSSVIALLLFPSLAHIPDTKKSETKAGQDCETLIMAAAHCGIDQFKEALERTNDLEQRDGYGLTALMYAVYKSKDSMVEMLLARGADINAAELDGTHFLSLTAVRDDREIARKLVAAGVNAKAREAAALLALKLGYREFVELLGSG